MTFADLALKPEILRAIEDVGYTSPTPIQAQAIPVILEGRDVLGIAQTGTGKTGGFTLPMIEALAQGRARARMPRSLILEPTRELAAQVSENFELYGKYERLSYALLIGGERFDEQVRKLDRGVDVLIATPGRMIDLFERGKILLADVRILVIDEADRMLDMGFIPDIERIVGLLPRQRQTLFFSATMPPEIRRLADSFLVDPAEIIVSPPSTTAEGVDQHLVVVHQEDKREALRRLIQAQDVRNALIFCNRKRDVDIVWRSLNRHGFNAGRLHGDIAQSVRSDTLERFKRGEMPILVSSDVAARGIDISDLSHVFNFDVPINPEDYVHRIGRTARAGRSGQAFTIATPGEGRYVSQISRLIKRELEPAPVDGLEFPDLEDEEAARRGRRSRRTGSKGRGGAEPARPAEPGHKAPARPAEPGHKAPAQAEPGHKAPAQAERRRGRRQPEPEDEPVVGLGEHVPAFLLRPVRRPDDSSRADQ